MTSPGVVRDAIGRLTCLPEGCLQRDERDRVTGHVRRGGTPGRSGRGRVAHPAGSSRRAPAHEGGSETAGGGDRAIRVQQHAPVGVPITH
jgi:hypothetical protein